MTSSSELTARFVTFEEMLSCDGYIVYTNVGTSMLPLLRERRDIVEIRPKPVSRCRKYDVVLYRRGKQYILHRVLKVLPEGYVIAGDHNTFLERDVTDAMILGVLTRVIRDGKSIGVNDWRYRLYVLIWCAPWPLRMLLLRLAAMLRSVCRRLKR